MRALKENFNFVAFGCLAVLATPLYHVSLVAGSACLIGMIALLPKLKGTMAAPRAATLKRQR